MQIKPIFFDHSSTTPVDPRVMEAMMPYFCEKFGNPSSHIHSVGREALKALDNSREIISQLIGAKTEEIIFTSGATESNNLAVKGISRAYRDRGNHILVSQIEHYSILNSAKRLRSEGFQVEMISVDGYGRVKLDELKEKLRNDTVLVSIMLSNTEIGTIEPIEEITNIVKQFNKDIIVHTDASSSAGWIPVDVQKLGVDALTISAHNFYGPKGAGALYLKEGVKIDPLLDGGFQEKGYRSGIENVPAIVGMAEAAKLAMSEMEERNKKLIHLQKKLWKGLEDNLDYLHFTGHPEIRLPGHVSFWVEFAEGESILLFLQVSGIMAASGSACSSNLRAQDEEDLVASHVLAAVGVPSDICSGSVTFLMGKDNTKEEVDQVVEALPNIIERLWAMSPAYADMLKEKQK